MKGVNYMNLHNVNVHKRIEETETERKERQPKDIIEMVDYYRGDESKVNFALVFLSNVYKK